MNFKYPLLSFSTLAAIGLSSTLGAVTREDRIRALAAPSRGAINSSVSKSGSSSSSSFSMSGSGSGSGSNSNGSSSNNQTMNNNNNNQQMNQNPFSQYGNNFNQQLKASSDAFSKFMTDNGGPKEDKDTANFLKQLADSKKTDNSSLNSLYEDIIKAIKELAQEQIKQLQEKYAEELALKQTLDAKRMAEATGIPSSPIKAMTAPSNFNTQSTSRYSTHGLFSSAVDSISQKAYNPPR